MIETKYDFTNWFVIAITFTLFTKLRLFNLPIGIGEIIFIFMGLIICIEIFREKNFEIYFKNIFILFWLVAFSLLIFGFLVSHLIDYPLNNKYIIHDLLAYGFISFLLVIFIYLKEKKYSYSKLMEKLIVINIFLYTFLFLLAINFDYFTYETFARVNFLSTNPNQVAILFTIIPFLIYYYSSKEFSYFEKYNYKFFILLSFVFIYKINSSALFVGIVLGILIYVFLNILQSKYKKIILLVLSILLIVSLILIVIDYQNSTQYIFLKRDIYYRVILYFNGLEALYESFFLGLGPGPHSYIYKTTPLELSEAHNIYIDWLTQTGILGLVLLIVLLFIIFKQLYLKQEYILIAALSSLLVFSFFHQTLRHPVFWFYLFYFYYMGTRTKCAE